MLPAILTAYKVAAAEVTTLVTEKVANGCMFTALSIAAVDRTTAIATLIEIGVIDGTRKIILDGTGGSYAAGESLTLFWASMLKEGQAFYATFTTPSAGDVLELVAHGYLEVRPNEI